MITVVKNTDGLASIEAMALLIVFAVLIGYGIGYFGAVHTAILNSIASRTYAFETYDNRMDVTYFRSNRGNDTEPSHYGNMGFRAHGVATEFADPQDPQWLVSERSISIGRPSERTRARTSQTDDRITGAERGSASPIWVKTVYGICINFECGGAGS